METKVGSFEEAKEVIGEYDAALLYFSEFYELMEDNPKLIEGLILGGLESAASEEAEVWLNVCFEVMNKDGETGVVSSGWCFERAKALASPDLCAKALALGIGEMVWNLGEVPFIRPSFFLYFSSEKPEELE